MAARPALSSRCLFLALGVLATAAARAADATAEGGTFYVIGQRVNLREQPSPAAPVRATLDINTPLQVLARSGSWCHVHGAGAPPLEGHVACALLAPAPVRLDDVEAAIERLQDTPGAAAAKREGRPPSPASVAELYARAFWVDPSPQRWARMAGAVVAITDVDGRPVVDPKTGHPMLPPDPDLGPARALMASGRVVASHAPAPIRLDATLTSELASALQRAPLPAARPSFFAQAADFDAVVPSGENTHDAAPAEPGASPSPSPAAWLDFGGSAFRVLEGLAHRSGAAVTMEVLGPWEAENNDEVVGMAGIGEARMTLSRLARIETVRGDGAIGTLPVQALRMKWVDVCNSPRSTVERPAPARGQPDVGASLVAWIGRAPVPGKVHVDTNRFDISSNDGHRPPLRTHRVDLDGDGTPDFFILERLFPRGQGGDDSAESRVVWVNVAGHWQPVDASDQPMCD